MEKSYDNRYQPLSGNGFSCDNIDECATDIDDCSDNAECVDTNGSYICECGAGYELSGSSLSKVWFLK